MILFYPLKGSAGALLIGPFDGLPFYMYLGEKLGFQKNCVNQPFEKTR